MCEHRSNDLRHVASPSPHGCLLQRHSDESVHHQATLCHPCALKFSVQHCSTLQRVEAFCRAFIIFNQSYFDIYWKGLCTRHPEALSLVNLWILYNFVPSSLFSNKGSKILNVTPSLDTCRMVSVVVGVPQGYTGTLEVWTFLGVLMTLESFYV